MTDFLHMALSMLPALVLGLVLGLAFFLILWITVQRGLLSGHPVSWFVGGLLLRMGLALSGFYFLAHTGWLSLLICLLGFIIARELVQRRLVVRQITSPNTLN